MEILISPNSNENHFSNNITNVNNINNFNNINFDNIMQAFDFNDNINNNKNNINNNFIFDGFSQTFVQSNAFYNNNNNNFYELSKNNKNANQKDIYLSSIFSNQKKIKKRIIKIKMGI